VKVEAMVEPQIGTGFRAGLGLEMVLTRLFRVLPCCKYALWCGEKMACQAVGQVTNVDESLGVSSLSPCSLCSSCFHVRPLSCVKKIGRGDRDHEIYMRNLHLVQVLCVRTAPQCCHCCSHSSSSYPSSL
jgi:hypothetical protein